MDEFDFSNSTISLSPDVARSSLPLRIIFLLNFCINLAGTCLHLALILVTCKNRKFHSTCNLLIAANSLCTVFAYALVLCPLAMLLVPGLRLSLLACFLIQLLPLFATFHVFSLMLVIGFDRLLSAFWALWYVSRNDRFCLLLLLGLSASFPLFITRIAFSNVASKPNAEKLCTLGDILGRQSSFVSLCCLGCICLSVCCYSLVWLRLKADIRAGQFETLRSRQPIFRSLCIILCLQVGGWVFGQLVYAGIYLNEQRISPLARWELNSLVLCFLSLVAAMDVPVLYSTSSEYRAALRRHFPWLAQLFSLPESQREKKVTPAAAACHLQCPAATASLDPRSNSSSPPLSRSPVYILAVDGR